MLDHARDGTLGRSGKRTQGMAEESLRKEIDGMLMDFGSVSTVAQKFEIE